MTAPDVTDAFSMLSDFLVATSTILASSAAYGDRGIQGLNDALYLFWSILILDLFGWLTTKMKSPAFV